MDALDFTLPPDFRMSPIKDDGTATDSSSSLLGIPSMPIAIPLAGTSSTPELYLFKSQKQFSTAKLALFAYERDSGRHVYSSGTHVGRASHKYYGFFLGLVKFTQSD